MPIIIILLLLVGCSHNGGDLKISLGTFYDIKSQKREFNQKLNSFQFLLKYAIDEMLNDLNNQDFGCIKNLTLDLSYSSPDLYLNIQQSNKLQKKKLSYKLHYTLYSGSEHYSGQIKTINSFVIPSNAYAYMNSKEDSEIAGINNLVKQLEHELTGILYNNCEQIEYKK